MTSTAVSTLPTFAQNMLTTLPAEMRNVFLDAFAHPMDTFGNSFNKVSLKGMQFSLIQGGQTVHTEPGTLNFVIVGLSPDQFCVWYANKFTNSDETTAPDAVWAMGEDAPANVPAAALQKDTDGRNQYSVRRRIVIAAFVPGTDGGPKLDLDNLYVWDMGGMTTFGPDLNIQNAGFGQAHSFAGYMNLMKNTGMIPVACMTRAMIDRSQSVPVARFFPHVTQNADGSKSITILDNSTLQRIAEVVKSNHLKELLDWRGCGVADKSLPTQVVQPQVQSVVQPQVQSVVQPQVQSVVQPQVQSVVQPQVQPVVQPQVQPVVQPQVQPDITQIMTQAVEQVQQQQQQLQAQPQTAAPASVGDELSDALAGLMSDAAFA